MSTTMAMELEIYTLFFAIFASLGKSELILLFFLLDFFFGEKCKANKCEKTPPGNKPSYKVLCSRCIRMENNNNNGHATENEWS